MQTNTYGRLVIQAGHHIDDGNTSAYSTKALSYLCALFSIFSGQPHVFCKLYFVCLFDFLVSNKNRIQKRSHA